MAMNKLGTFIEKRRHRTSIHTLEQSYITLRAQSPPKTLLCSSKATVIPQILNTWTNQTTRVVMHVCNTHTHTHTCIYIYIYVKGKEAIVYSSEQRNHLETNNKIQSICHFGKGMYYYLSFKKEKMVSIILLCDARFMLYEEWASMVTNINEVWQAFFMVLHLLFAKKVWINANHQERISQSFQNQN